MSKKLINKNGKQYLRYKNYLRELGKAEQIAVENTAKPCKFTEYLYFKLDGDPMDIHADAYAYFMFLRNTSFDTGYTDANIGGISIDILHCIYKLSDGAGTSVYFNDPHMELGSGFLPAFGNGAIISIAIPKYTSEVTIGSGTVEMYMSNNFVDTLELMKSAIGVDYKEFLKYQITEEEFWKEATITDISVE